MNCRLHLMLAPIARPALPLLLATSAALAGSPRPIALTGTDGAYGPQLGAGVTFANFYTVDLPNASPALNAAGQAVFLARLAGPGIDSTNDTGVWVQTASGLRLAARTGDPAPNTEPGVVFSGFFSVPNIDAAGRTAFDAIIAGPGVTYYDNDGLWSEGGSGVLHLVIREGDPVPGGGGIFENRSSPGNPTPTLWANNPVIMNAGVVSQRAYINPGSGQGNPFGAWMDRSGVLEAFMRADYQPVPGYPGWFFIVAGNANINASHVMVAMAWRTDGTNQRRGLWTDRSGTLLPVIETGDPIPGWPGEGLYSVDDTALNDAGRTAISISVTTDFYWGVLSEARYGVLQLIARTGIIAPGTDGASFYYVSSPVISNNGVTAFSGSLLVVPPVTDATSRGLWCDRDATLQLVARSGNPAPGAPGASYVDFFAMEINAGGQIAFVASLSDGVGLFFQNTSGTVQLVARDFQPLDLFGDGSDIRLITGLATPEVSGWPGHTAGTGDGRRAYLNDSGDLAFRLRFADGSEGVFSTVAAPPAFRRGDMNCDGMVNFDDINPFVTALVSQQSYESAYPDCRWLNGDIDNNAAVNFDDINPFVGCLVAGGCP